VFAERVMALRDAVERSRPAHGFREVRMPGDRSQQARRANVDAPVYVDDAVYERLLQLAGWKPADLLSNAGSSSSKATGNGT
jgi:LDH2 family malate/lactate/ureidoglycolate dehydrogenase